MIKQRDRIIIAVLLPVAIILVVVAVVYYKGYAKSAKQRDANRTMLTETEKKKRQTLDRIKDKPGEVGGKKTSKPRKKQKESFQLVPVSAAQKMNSEKRAEILGNILAILKTEIPDQKSSDQYSVSRRTQADRQVDRRQPDDMSNAYFSLLNFREKAVPELLRWVKDEPVARYYALKAFVAFRRDFATESTDPKNRFLDAALSVLPEVGLGERIQIAQLLGYYREDQARSVLREMIDSDELAVAHSAIVSLARVGESSDALLLARLLDSENAVIRTAACDALDSLLNFHAGTDLVLPADYYAALDKRVSEWKKWLAENKTKLSPKSS